VKKTEDVYLKLLRKALHLQPQEPEIQGLSSLSEWQELTQLCQMQGTALLVYDEAMKMPHLLRITDPAEQAQVEQIMLLMKQICFRNMLLQEEMRTTLSTVYPALEENIAPTGERLPVLLKGFGLARLYPQPHLRQWGDIDIYVGTAGYHIAAQTLKQMYPDSPSFESEEDYFKHWNINVGNTPIEAHRVSAVLSSPSDNALWHRLEEQALLHDSLMVEIDAQHYRIPEVRFNALFVFLHSWHHFTESESANMKQIADLTMLLHDAIAGQHTTLEAMNQYLSLHLKALGLIDIWQAYAYIMVRYLGLPESECPLWNPRMRTRGEYMLRRIMHPQPTSHTSAHAPKCVLLRKAYTLGVRIGDALRWWPFSPTYVLHTIAAIWAAGFHRLCHGDWTRKWE